MTVSRVINGEARVSQESREQVEAAIQQLGYVPNVAARSLAGARQCRLALLYNNPSSSYLSELLVGCMTEASALDAQLLVESCEGYKTTEALARHLVHNRIDAVVLPGPLCDDKVFINKLTAAGLSVAQVTTASPLAHTHAVYIDNQLATREMTRHLIAMGHSRIGFIEGSPKQTTSKLRRAGYEQALREAGIAIDPALIVPGDYSFRSGISAADRLLALNPRPTAIFASNDDMAAAVIATAHRLKLDVPTDLSVCGFDDTPLATTIWPELTTIRQPVREMAQLATQILVKSFREEEADPGEQVCHQQVDFELVRRQSDATRPAGA